MQALGAQTGDTMRKLLFQLIQVICLFASQATIGCSLKEFAYVIVDFHGVVFFPLSSFFSLAFFIICHLSLLFLPDLTDAVITRKLHSVAGI